MKNINTINVFILNWCSVAQVERCVSSILESIEVTLRIFLINNYSTHEDYLGVEAIFFKTQSLGVECYLLNNKENIGYSGGNNSAYKFLVNSSFSGDVLIINPDVRVSPNALMIMLEALTGNVGIVTPKTLNANGRFMHGAIRLRGFSQEYMPELNKGFDVTDYAQGSCMLISRLALEKNQIFDNRFFMYWEEVELSLKIRKLNMRLIVANEAIVFREKNELSREPLVFYYSIRNSRLVKKLHPEFFTKYQYFIYVVRMLLLTIKFINRPLYFFRVVNCCFAGLLSSFCGVYGKKGE